MKPYYEADGITIYHGDCREVDAWHTADVMVTDPPYGRNWRQGALSVSDAHHGIANDMDTSTRDEVLTLWLPRPALIFGDLMLAPPPGTKQVLVYRKAPNAGARGAIGGFRRDAEAIYVMGHGWGSGIGGESSVLATSEPSQGNPYSPAGKFRHPHAKPDDIMGRLVSRCDPSHVVVDPFMGSGSTLVAAKARGLRCIGIEVEERYCEIAAKRLAQGVLDFGGAA